MIEGRHVAPRPIPADTFGFKYFGDLAKAYRTFCNTVKASAFFKPYRGPKVKDADRSVTSFLCSDAAWAVFTDAYQEFFDFVLAQEDERKKLKFPDFPKAEADTTKPRPLKNSEVVKQIRRFFQYATFKGNRGTPHKL